MNEDKKKQALEKLKSVEPRNYWNTSGLGKDSFPLKPDPKSTPNKVIKKDKQGNVKVRIPVEPENEWWIDSKEDQYDFWVWLDRNSTHDGKMEPMQQSEIGKMFGCSATKIHFIIKQAIEKLKASDNHLVLAEYLKEDPEDEAISVNASDYDTDTDYE